MLISELKKYIAEILLQEAQNPSTSKIPVDLIDDIFYCIHDNIIPNIFDFILSNNLNLDELFANHSAYAIPLQKLIENQQSYLIPFFNILIEDQNWDFLNNVLIDQNILKNVKLDVLYYHKAGHFWSSNSRVPPVTSLDLSALGFCNFLKYDKNQMSIELFIAINLSQFLIPYLFDLYANNKKKYFAEASQRNQINNELRITIRHELEHYYQSINQLLYQVQKEYALRVKYNSFANLADDCHHMIEHYILSDDVMSGFGFAAMKTDYIRKIRNPFKIKSTFYMSQIDRSYLYDEAEIPNHINDFCLIFTSYARHVFASSSDAVLWLRNFSNYLKGCAAEDVSTQLWLYLDSGLWFGKNVMPHTKILQLFQDNQINVWDANFRDYISYFIDNMSRVSKFLLFLHEIFSDLNVIQDSLRKEIVDVNRYLNEFRKVKKYVIEKMVNKIYKLWNTDLTLNPMED